MATLFHPYAWSPAADFAVFTLVTGWLIWRTARAFFEKKEKKWPPDALRSLAEAKSLRQSNELLMDKLRQSHAELEVKQAKIDALRAESDS